MSFLRWTREVIAPGEAHCHEVTGEIYVKHDPLQTIEVVETRSFGRGLLLDGRIQHMEKDEYIYSEALVHPVALALGKTCQQVLLVGGGPGGAVRELLKHNSVKQVVQVEIDQNMVAVSRTYFKHIADGFPEDPRYRLVIADIHDYIRTLKKQFDLVVYDVSEPMPGSPAQSLFGSEVFGELSESVRSGGAFITWAGAVGPCSDGTANNIFSLTADTFSYTEPLLCHTQSYGTSWLFVVGSHTPLGLKNESLDDIDGAISRLLTGTLKYYDGQTHQHMVSLPRDVRQRLASVGTATQKEFEIL